MDTPAFLDHLRKLPFYHDQIVHREYIPPRETRHQQLEKPLQPALQAALEASHLFPLYSHQAAENSSKENSWGWWPRQRWSWGWILGVSVLLYSPVTLAASPAPLLSHAPLPALEYGGEG
ncbi:hypothetical protein M1N82_00925 [Dehalococcoidia bacterium]|nr:hypothetical protein [Dehalococcoidia bacterium]